ncbi:MAG: NAD(P)-binding domain-containing protein, partial [Gammaproteobacteria bacterium]|nr:NAD(P)-binding domain-containing protein [Gammaproteobacteria bacterium]
MKLQITCIWFSLFTLVGTSQTGYAAEPTEPQPKETIALIGTGDFGNSFGPRLAALGYPIVYGSRNPESDKVKALLKKTGHGSTATTQKDAAQQGDIVMLLLPWPAMETITQNLGDMSGKVMIDVSWPPVEITDDGYYLVTIDTSSAEMIQDWNPGAMVVKAFGTLGSNIIDDPLMAGGPVTVPMASNYAIAKEKTAAMAVELGLDPVDAGPLHMARNIEAMMLLYYVPYMQGRKMGWEFYFRRTNYWMCNTYVPEGGE